MNRMTAFMLSLVMLAALGACRSAELPEPEKVYIGVYEPGPELVEPEYPERKSTEIHPAEVGLQTYIRALGTDLTAAWAQIELLHHIIRSYNESRPEPREAPIAAPD